MNGVEGPMHTRSDTKHTIGVGLRISREEEQATNTSPVSLSQGEGLLMCKFDNTALDLEKIGDVMALKTFWPRPHVAVGFDKTNQGPRQVVPTPPEGGMSDIDSEARGSSDDSAELVDVQDGDWDWGEQEPSATRCLSTPMHDACAPRAAACSPVRPAPCPCSLRGQMLPP